MSSKKRSSSSDDGVTSSKCSPGHSGTEVGAPLSAGPTSGRTYKSKRTVLTRNACIRCRVAKTKCNGKHPSCARCQAGGVQCVYDVTSEGITKMQDLQQKLESKTQDLSRVMAIINIMQQGSDQDATEILARLRLGDPLQKVVDAVAARGSPPISTAHSTAARTPMPMRTLPPVSMEPNTEYRSYSIPTSNNGPCHSGRRDSLWPISKSQTEPVDYMRNMLPPSPTSSDGSFQSVVWTSLRDNVWPATPGDYTRTEGLRASPQRMFEPLPAHAQAAAANGSRRATTY